MSNDVFVVLEGGDLGEIGSDDMRLDISEFIRNLLEFSLSSGDKHDIKSSFSEQFAVFSSHTIRSSRDNSPRSLLLKFFAHVISVLGESVHVSLPTSVPGDEFQEPPKEAYYSGDTVEEHYPG